MMITGEPVRYIRFQVWHVEGTVKRYGTRMFQPKWFESEISRVRVGSALTLFGEPAIFSCSLSRLISVNTASCRYFSHERMGTSDIFVIQEYDAHYLISSLIESSCFQIVLADDDPAIQSFNPTMGVFPDDTPPIPLSLFDFELVEDEEYED